MAKPVRRLREEDNRGFCSVACAVEFALNAHEGETELGMTWCHVNGHGWELSNDRPVDCEDEEGEA